MKEELNFDDFWNRLKTLTKEKGITQVIMCNELGFDLQTFRNRKITKNFPNVPDMQKIALYFDTTIDYLLTGSINNVSLNRISVLEQKLNLIKEIVS